MHHLTHVLLNALRDIDFEIVVLFCFVSFCIFSVQAGFVALKCLKPAYAFLKKCPQFG